LAGQTLPTLVEFGLGLMLATWMGHERGTPVGFAAADGTVHSEASRGRSLATRLGGVGLWNLLCVS
jgi:hypothetical protein